MRKITLFIMRAVFRFCCIFPVKTSKIVLLKNFPVWGSLGALGDYLERRSAWRVLRLTPRSPLLLYHLATARAVFLNNNFTPLAHIGLKKQTKVIQLWHADGALKQWGSGTNPYPYDAVICADERLRPYWAEAFQVPAERVLALGSPLMDQFMQPCDVSFIRARFDARYPQCKGKRLILYAPTFREDPAQNAALLSHFDFAAFSKRFPDAALLVRLHPGMHGAYKLPESAIDVTSMPDATAMLRICGCLVTDYSSICVDAAVLDIPVILYQFDEAEYRDCFYVPFRVLAPGPIANNFNELLDFLALLDEAKEQRSVFAAFHAGIRDGRACERLEALLENETELIKKAI